MSDLDLVAVVRALGQECHETVIREGAQEPCDKPAVAVRIDPQWGEPYRVCARHARTGDLMVPLPEVERAVRERVAAELAFTDAEWREYQAIPDQGYSHRAWLDDRAARIARGES